MRAVSIVVGCAIAVGCGGGSNSGGDDSLPPTGDAAGRDAADPNAKSIKVTLNNAPSDGPAFTFVAAYQDGDGAWQPALARTGDAYTFAVNSPTWGFAYTCEVNVRVGTAVTDLRDIVEFHFATAERTALTQDILTRCTDRISYVELSGTISNRSNTGTYRVAFNGNSVFIDKTAGTYDMLVQPGTHDLLVLHGTDRNTPGDFLVDGAVVQRNVAITAATVHNAAGNTTSSTPSLAVSVSGAGASTSNETTTNLFTANGTVVSLAQLSKTPLASTGLPNSQAAAGDLYDQHVTVEIVKNQAVTATSASATAAALTVPAPAALGATTTTSAATMPYPIFTSTWPGYASAIGYTWSLAQTPPAAGCGTSPVCTITWTASVSPGAAKATPSYTMPDLSQLPGWSTALQFVAGTMATGDVTAMTSSAGAMDFPPGPPAAGTKRVFAHSTFTATP
jgi:hypothetical protein